MRPSVIVCSIAFLLAIAFTGSYGAINPILNYQGSLTDSSGVPYSDGTHQLIFSIYADSVAGAALWSETLDLVSEHGLIHAYLGQTQPFPTDLFESYPLYLGIACDSKPEFKPRLLVAASVYTFLARNSQNLGGFPADHFADTSKIATAVTDHNTDQTAHHPMQIDAAEIVSGVFDPDRVPPLVIDSSDIINGSIAARNLADSIVTGSKLAAGAVQQEHLAASSVTGEKVVDGSLTGDDLADSTVTGSKIAANAIQQNHLADSAVTSSKIATGAIHSEHLSVSALSGANIEDGTVTGVDLADSTVTGSKIAPGSIQSEHLSVSAFSGANIEDGSITTADLADSTVTGDKIAEGQIQAAHLAANSVDGSKVVDESITGAKIDDGSIGSNDIGGGVIVASHLADRTVNGAKVALNTLTGLNIQDGSLSTGDLGPSSVGTVQIMDNSVTTDDIEDNTITATDCEDEPGLAYTNASILSSVGTTITNWMSLTFSAPASGYIVVFFTCIANIANNEIAQTSISTSPSTFGIYGEARLVSSAASTGANMTISISDVIPVAGAGDVDIYANVRATAASAGPVDFYQGHLQAIFIRTAY
ncbi:MAG: hypothetical protein E4G91_06065 [Candidatus Zixiibacteriota bacterium]|nr:MAG: hypothetical protein E4G91_06065 [candidate division Zixibacteria bacterium]